MDNAKQFTVKDATSLVEEYYKEEADQLASLTEKVKVDIMYIWKDKIVPEIQKRAKDGFINVLLSETVFFSKEHIITLAEEYPLLSETKIKNVYCGELFNLVKSLGFPIKEEDRGPAYFSRYFEIIWPKDNKKE